jgi:hypothetical protein
MLLVGCSEVEKASMPPAEYTQYILDLSGSNDSLDQFERLKPDIYKKLKSNVLGDPYSMDSLGPVDLSLTFILGSASQARVLNITSAEFGQSLFRDLPELFGRSTEQLPDDWQLVLAANKASFEVFNDLGKNSLAGCVKDIFPVMEKRLGLKNSNIVAERICQKTMDSLNIIERDIPNQFKMATGSDIFGAFREVDTWVDKIRGEQPMAKIKVLFASDMVHYTKGERDFFGKVKPGLLTGKLGKEEICAVAEEQARLSGLNLKGVQVATIGRGNSKAVSADEGEALAIFWRCFAKSSGFELESTTDGSSS